MKHCIQCGAELPNSARFCMTCGASQEVASSVQDHGTGALAQAGGVAAGAGGVAVGGDVQGGVYVGSAPKDPAEALRVYRRVLAATCRKLPLRGIDLDASDPIGAQKQVDLAQVYVDLDTTVQIEVTDEEKEKDERRRGMPGERETRPLGVLEAAAKNRRLVLLGDPGSGKSTFVNHLAYILAMHGLEPEGGWLNRLPNWPEDAGDLVPIPVVLRDFAQAFSAQGNCDQPCHLWDFIVGQLKAQNLDAAVEPLHDVLEEGQVIVLLDGLDEIPTSTRRVAVRQAVAAFARRYPESRVLVTCRTLSYQDPAWQLEGVPSFELAPFDAEKIDAFIDAWHAELNRLGVVNAKEARNLGRKLHEAVRRPDLWRLAPNPLLLTVMALVHTHKGRLPDARALLYEDTVDILLWRWEQIKAGGDEDAPRMRQLLLNAGRTDVDLKRTVWRLAYEAHQEGGAGDGEALADIGELQLQRALATLHPDDSRDWAYAVIQAMKLRAGLLLERAPGVYTFPHRTFQEYLAGAHLSTQADFAREATELVEEEPFWRVAVLLAVGRLVYLGGDTARPLALVGELCPAEAGEGKTAWRKAWLAGEVLVEIGLNRVQESALGRDLGTRVRHRLVDLLRGGHLSAVERAEAGDVLAQLGDPRFREDAWFLPDEPLLGFVEIPEGPFLMGSDKERDPMAYDDEQPQHKVDLPAYYVARYPVTVAQFHAFVEESGYEPGDSDSLRGVSNHPVMWVSWHEALKYCEWLTERLRAWDEMPEPLATLLREEGWAIILPSEAEWEKAARGTDGRIFPWGEQADPERANYSDTGIGTTSAVGCFPDGASPYEVEDLSGNVWEWTRSLWGTDWQKPDFGYPYDSEDGREDLKAANDVRRVLRGGSFFNGETFVRCAFRYRGLPLNRWNDGGFRVVASPVRSDL